MKARAVRFVLGPALLIAAVTLSAQERVARTSTSVASPAALSGKWTLDDDAVREDARNWRRPVGGSPFAAPPAAGAGGMAPVGGGMGAGGGGGFMGPSIRPRPAGSLGEPFDSDIRRALRDLLEVTRSFEISIAPAQVTITDDLARVFTFNTDGRREKQRAGGTQFDVRTTWDGPVLVQDITAYREFKMTQEFRPSDDGRQMFVWLTVDKPALVPPIRELRRVYTRAQ